MRFLIDESADGRLANLLNALGHEATLVAQHHGPGISDPNVLAIARAEGRILITDDRDFGELVFRYHEPHLGVIDFRLSNARFELRSGRLLEVLERYPDRLGEFIVVTDDRERFAS